MGIDHLLPVITAVELADAASEAVSIKHANSAEPTRCLVTPIFCMTSDNKSKLKSYSSNPLFR